MKKFLLTFFASFFLFSGFASAKMSAFFSFCTFNQPQGSPYIETYLTVIGSSVNFSPNTNQKLQSKIEVQWVLKREDSIVFFDKYNLLSAELENVNSYKPNFMDQQRIQAANGSYTLELSITDKNSNDQKFTTSQKVVVNFPVESVSISDIELLESYTKSAAESKMSKSGYDLVPYISDFYPETMEYIRFYCEVYNTKLMLGDDFYLARYAIINDNNKQVLNDLVVSRKMKTADVSVLMGEFPLSQVMSGNYTLNFEIRDKSNEMLAHKAVFFQRSFRIIVKEIEPTDDFTLFDVNNTFVSFITNKDTLKDYIACLYPISGKSDRQIADNQIAIANVKSMQQYFYYYWARQDKVNPEKRWMDYKNEVDKVKGAYGTRITKGYDSDRGRVYLQYGPPNTIETSENDPNTYPYEIWHYYNVGGQTNKKFVFYSRDRSSNNYVLLHSDVTGEPSAYDWQLKLHEKTTQFGNDLDADKAPKTYGDRSEDMFRNPK
ncbi:MAG: GWxTD domain-containing protein [Bacteroidetes bacterium]|nr:GWxTD domain-containing protein [Bacteroidota bacterium]